MRLQSPLETVTPTVDGPVLAVLAARTHPVSVSEIHTAIGDYSREGIRRALKRLTAQGIVLRGTENGHHIYHLNREHVAADAVVRLSDVGERFQRQIRDHLALWPKPPLFAGLRANGHPTRRPNAPFDILLLIEAPSHDIDDALGERFARLATRVRAWSGNPVHFLLPHQRADDPESVRLVLATARDFTPLIGTHDDLQRWVAQTLEQDHHRAPTKPPPASAAHPVASQS